MIDDADRLSQPPEKGASDHALSVAKFAVSFVPGTSPILELLGLAAPFGRRMETWISELHALAEDLRQRVDGIEARLGENELFVSALQYSTEIALRSHQQEKWDALRNALRSIALTPGDDDKRMVFLRFVDELTPLHLRVLDFADRNLQIAGELRNAAGPRVSIDYAVDDLWDHICSDVGGWRTNDLLILVREDLQRRRLVYPSFLDAQRPGTGFVSPLGQEFLSFIRDDTSA